MAKQTPAQKTTVERVMHAFKEGDLDQRDGEPVKDPKQAIAIALREAGASNQESPARNRAALKRTKARERNGENGPTRDTLYAEARRRDIAGRSTMTKAQLQKALDA